MKNFCIILLVSVLLASCKKDEESPAPSTNENPFNYSYPVSFSFDTTTSVTPIRVFLKSGEITAPNCRAAIDTEIVNFDHHLSKEYQVNLGTKVILTDSHHGKLINDEEEFTFYYRRLNGALIMNEIIAFKENANGLILEEFFYIRTLGEYPYRDVNEGEVGLGDLRTEMTERLGNSTDTIAVRTYGLFLKKQP